MRPFCSGDRVAERAFDRWRGYIAAKGVDLVELSAADAFALGLLASREVALERLRREVRAEKRDQRARLSLVAAERRAAADFIKVLELCDRIFGARAAVAEVARPVAVAAGGGGRVLRMPARDRLPPRGKAPEALVARILAALAGSGELTKPALRARVRGDHGTFLRVLDELVRAGQVKRRGAGTRGFPFRYTRGGS